MAKKEMDWPDLIEQGIRYKKEFGDSERWGVYRDYYRGAFAGFAGLGEGDILPYNITFGMARATIPRVYFRNPYINVSPRLSSAGAGLDVQARLVESVDNWLIQEMNVKTAMKEGVLDAFFTDRAIWKIGYDSQYGYRPSASAIDFGLAEEESGQLSKGGKRLEHHVDVKQG
ncbi:unnamed protein product, partial [marine sediment metagenome]